MSITTYDYTNEQGKLIYQVIREDFPDGGKTFKQRRADGKWTLTGVTLVPYHLPDVLRTIRQNGLVILVEGEKCADTLNAALKAAGVAAVATCNNGGAGHWGAEQSKWLTGAKVLLLPDNDEPGRNHVDNAARFLKGLAVCTKCVDLPDLPEKGDIADWLKIGHTVDDLRTLYRNAPDYVPLPVETKPVAAPPVYRKVDKDDRPRLTAWALRALEGETAELSRLSDGRYRAMKAAANRLGTIAAHGLLSESECLAGLRWAMDANGYSHKKGKGEHGAEKEAAFYFKSGLSHPCQLPAARELPALEKGVPEDFVAYIPPTTKTEWMGGVPIAVRGLFNAYLGTGPLLELLIEGRNKRDIDDQYLTVGCLVWLSRKYGRGITEGVIRTMVRQAENPHGAAFLRKTAHITDHSMGSLLDHDQLDPCADFQRNPCGCRDEGRSPEHYSLLPIDAILTNLARFINAPLIEKAFPVESNLIAPLRIEFIAALDEANADSLFEQLHERYSVLIESQPGFAEAMAQVRSEHRQVMYRLRNPQSAPLPDGAPYPNTAAYKVLCAIAFLNSKQGKVQVSRKLLGAYLGCTDKALKSILDRAGVLIVKHCYAELPVHSVVEFQALRNVYDKRLQGFPRHVQAGDKRVGFRVKDVVSFVEAHLADGATVKVLYHQANIYRFKCPVRLTMGLINWLLKALAVEYAEPVEPQPELLPELKETEPEVIEEPKAKQHKPKCEYKAKVVKETYPELYIKRLAIEATAQSQDTAQQALNALLNHEIVPSDEDQSFQPVINVEHLVNKPKPKENPFMHVPDIQKIYNQWTDARYQHTADTFFNALPARIQEQLLAFAADEFDTPIELPGKILTPREKLMADPFRLSVLRDLRTTRQWDKSQFADLTPQEVIEFATLPLDQMNSLIESAQADLDEGFTAEWLDSIGATASLVDQVQS